MTKTDSQITALSSIADISMVRFDIDNIFKVSGKLLKITGLTKTVIITGKVQKFISFSLFLMLLLQIYKTVKGKEGGFEAMIR